MTEADIIVTEVTNILRTAGFEPMPEGPLADALCKVDGRGNYVFGGVVRAIGEVHAWDAGLSTRTTNDPVEAAQKLAAYVAAKMPAVVIDDVVSYEPPTPLVDDQWPMEGLAPETRRPVHLEPPMPVFEEAAEAAYGGEDETHGETGEQPSGDAVETSALGEDLAHAPAVDGSGGPGAHADDDAAAGESDRLPAIELADLDGPQDEVDLADEPLDADFTEAPERDALDATLFPERGIAWSEEDEPEAEPDTTGPIAYAASDLDALVREKLGRVSQIARELKAALQDGWTIDEFRSLQNLIVRIDRGEASDDAEARARFVAISERSQAMSRVDAHRDALEAALDAIGKARDYQGAKDFNPEQGWP